MRNNNVENARNYLCDSRIATGRPCERRGHDGRGRPPPRLRRLSCEQPTMLLFGSTEVIEMRTLSDRQPKERDFCLSTPFSVVLEFDNRIVGCVEGWKLIRPLRLLAALDIYVMANISRSAKGRGGQCEKAFDTERLYYYHCFWEWYRRIRV